MQTQTACPGLGMRSANHSQNSCAILFGCRPPGNTPEGDRIRDGVPAQAVGTMDPSGDLARGKEPGDNLTLRIHHMGLRVDLDAAPLYGAPWEPWGRRSRGPCQSYW